MTDLFTIENGIALLTLTALEVVLGIDNIVFISIISDDLPPEQQPRARRIGLILAMLMRIVLLLAIGWIMGLSSALFTVFGHGVSGRDLILIAGGLFLIGKATVEMHNKVEGHAAHPADAPKVKSMRAAIVQILLLDAVFSLDSVITAVGMAKHIIVMIVAVVIAVGIMILSAERIAGFMDRHPTLKMLALAFLVLIGVVLVADGLTFHINKGYVYFAMAFSLGVEMLNIRVRAAKKRRRAN